VVKDFNFDTLHSGIEPAVFMCGFRQYLSVRIRAGNAGRTLEVLKTAMAKSAPSQPFDFFFLDDAYNELYGKERKLGEIFGYFAGLAIFIACLGLFSLAAFMAERKTKEIGVRKVLGASSTSILLMLNKSFLRWIIAANIISWPLAYYAMTHWLQDFNYRISLG
jgi:putative ABC transport system permease protein